MKFQEVSSKLDLAELEKKIALFWQKNKVLDKYLQKNKKAKKRFSFLDGPITANNPMGVHHAWGRTLKDLYQRYKNMRGFSQRFQNGFDNQGLWVEVEVEKKLGFKSKKDIETYGIAKFVGDCKEHTRHFARVQTEQSKRLGYFMDWGNDYYTMSDENNYAIWHFLKTCYQKGWLYKGEDVVPWCARCGTSISQHEILTGDYKEITHRAVYLKYPLVGKDKEFLLVWTTTPWTLPANVAVAFNPEVVYVRVKTKDEVLFLAKSCLKALEGDYEILQEMTGNQLADLEYIGAFDELTIVRQNIKTHPVVEWKDGVSEEEGTGLVHMSTGSGPEDYQRGKEIGLPVFGVLDEAGNYVEGYDEYTGIHAQAVAEKIFKHLENKNFLYKTEDYQHRYPLCWRCRSELLFRLVDEWYIKMDELRQQMMAVAKKIRWIPDFGLKLELDWLENMHDWLISKKRYWGLCLPIWECECGHFEVIGSKEELKEKAVEGWDKFEGQTPHRPWVDEVKIKCPECGKIMKRIADVGNPWLDAGIVSFSTLKYFEDKDYWQKWFPADLVLECFPGQFKNWFYSLIAMATALENTNPFKTLLGHALVRDETGREMHKSWGNAIDFDEAAEKMGADLMRWLYVRQNPTLNLNFGYGPAEDLKKQFLLIFWNCYKFFIGYAISESEAVQKQIRCGNKPSNHILDRWILSRLNGLVKLATEKMDNFDHSPVALAIEDFAVNDFSTWYVRRSRDRVGPNAIDQKDKLACYNTFCRVFLVLMKLMAPMAPFLTEEMWQNLVGESSVHLSDWPEPKPEMVDLKLEEEMNLMRRICSLGHAIRKEQGIKVRQPLASLKFKIQNSKFKIEDDLMALIKDELNVKEVEFVKEIKEQAGWLSKEEDGLKVFLNTEIPTDLRQEGWIREMIRQIQDLRKEAGLKPSDKISIQAFGSPALNQVLEKNKDFVSRQTIARELKVAARAEDFDFEKQTKIDNQDFWLGIKKIKSPESGK